MTPLNWIMGRDTGTSSKTIFAVMMGELTERETQCGGTYGVPHDQDDFGRCYRLLELFPDWKKRIGEMAHFLPAWVPYVREWDRLTALHKASHGKWSQEFHDFIDRIEEESRIADGWKKTGKGSWTRGKAWRVELSPTVSISTGL